MREDEKRAHAERILRDMIRSAEFCEVYEDDELEGVSDRDLSDIHSRIVHAEITVQWPTR